MPDSLLFADNRAARCARPSDGALELTGRSPAVSRVQELVRRGALLEGGVLLTAEPGADVVSVAREFHQRGRQPNTPFVILQCDDDPVSVDRRLFGAPPAALPADLEAVSPDSALAAARGGTLFVQNVTELRASAQAQLARVARDGEVRIDGAAVATEMRIIGSAAPGIETEVHSHRFRADLYRRLSAIRIDLPSLRDRPDDVPVLATRVLDEVCAASGRPRRTFTQAALALLAALTWPGNLQELRAAIERVVDETRDEVIQLEHLFPALQLDRARAAFVPSGDLREARLRFERDYISAVLQHHEWRMAAAAQTLGIQRPNLYRKARQLGIPVARFSEIAS